MKLMTKEIEKAARKNYEMGSDMEQMIVAKFFDPCGSWTYYLMNMGDDNDYCWGIVDGFEVEMGSFSLKELSSVKNRLGLGMERDMYFEPMKAIDLWNRLKKGEKI